MADGKNNTEEREWKSHSYDSQEGECESVKLLCGPPFDPRDYMISPSESESDSIVEKKATEKKKLIRGPCDIKIDEKYILDSSGALKKLLELIRNGCVRPFAGRIKDLISKYLRGRVSGFRVDELTSIVEIVEYFSRNKRDNPEFVEFVDILMRGMKNPPVVGKSSDLLSCEKILADYFTVFGELLATFEGFDFQIRLLQSLECLITRRNLSEVTAVKVSICHEAIGESHLPYAIAALMETVSFDLYFYYLDISIQIIMASLKAGQIMIESDILDFVLRRLNICEESKLVDSGSAAEEAFLNEYYTLLEKSSYLLWGLLTIVSREDENVPAPGECALRSLKIVFERESRKKSCKALNARNNLAGLIVKLCAVFKERLPLDDSGLVVDIAVMAIATEIGTRGTWLEECSLGTTKEDYVLKKMMLLSCCLMPCSEKTIETIKSLKVIEGILILINPRSKSHWIPSQYFDLFYVALRTLSELVPRLPEVFVLNRGNDRLVSAMKWFMEDYFDRGSLLEILRTFYVIVTCKNNKCIIEDILARDFVGFLLELCSYLIKIESIKSEDQEKLTRIFVVLERLFRNERKLLAKYSETCSSVAVSLLNRILTDSCRDSKWNSHLLVSFGGFIWESIAWSSTALESFIRNNGIFHLCDIVELSSFPVQMLFLGILVEMTDGGKSILHLSTWRGKSGFGILDLMIRIWREEEKITKVHRTENGFIQDIEMPLMTEEQWYLTHQIRGSHNYSPSVAEMNCSARPKIHALYQFLRERYRELTKISESSYAILLERVRPSYQVYIPLIEHFLSLKMGEIWFEVLRDSTTSGVIPTASDGNVMCTLIDEKNKWAARIKTMQEEIALLQEKKGSEDEKNLYNLLKTCRLTSFLEALSELDYVARTSVHKFQNQRKEKQVQDVEKSLEALSFPPHINIHRTFLSKINATCFCANYVRIKSEKEEYETISIVSSESSECNHFSTEDELNAN